MNLDKPIVFLDIDGVLNSSNWFRKLDGKRDWLSHLDPEAVDCLNEIKDWNFILSSTWRLAHTLEDVNTMLKARGFLGELIGKTPVLNWKGRVRGNEIELFLEDYPGQRFVIFDDDSDMLLSQRHSFIHIDGFWGISPNVIYRARYLMGEL